MKSHILFRLFLVVTLFVAAIGFFAEQDVPIVAQDSEDTLTSFPVSEAPTLDGVADEAFWEEAVALEVDLRRGANNGETTVSLRSVYTEDSVYFLATWADPTHSYERFPWELQEDGTWIQLRDPDDMGGDDNLWYEDKFALIWEINEIEYFDEEGCMAACHLSDDDDFGSDKPYGNKFTENEDGLGDMWHWKSVRNLNQLHDQYLDGTRWSPDAQNAGRHSDPAESGGYSDNVDNTDPENPIPAFMPAGDAFPRDGSPGYILASEAVPFDASLFEPGDRLPGIVISEFVGDGGDIAAGWVWQDGFWTLEFGRTLVTESEYDIQFSEPGTVYLFGVATFDNAQVRHAFHNGVLYFVFGQEE